MDRFGRKMTIQIGALICLVGAILQAAAKNLGMILAGRIFAGWAVGLLSMSVPVYQSECAHPKIRGLIVGMSQQMIGIGFIVSTWVGFGSAHAGDQSQFQWRFPLAFQAVPCVILAVGMIFFPESPRHLMATDREEEAMRVLKKLHYNGSNGDWVESEFNEIKQTLAAEKSVTVPGWRVMFTVPQWRTRLFHGVAVQLFTQFSGINVIGYYQVIMYKALGFTGGKAILISGIYNCVGPVSTLICEGAVNSQNTEGTRHSLSIAGVFFIFLVSIIFSFSFGSISWVYMGEIMPMQIRARGNAFATGIGNWLVATFLAQISPIALGKIGWKFYFVFVAFNIVITFPVIFFFFKETNQVSLEDIDLLFGERALGALPKDLNKEGALEVLPETVGVEVADVKV
ncbi:MFS glucose transporter [Lachnellula occidentalis]|uniref:MFS glucose transporter n=1 Tax=Lachnellula occidentalis TaxID=215460 RepID=A0A8H8S8P2_9HELO|nr:MFS glucose transporter [Lachnellula occidentalis]